MEFRGFVTSTVMHSTNKTEGGGKGSNSARILLDAVEPAMDAFFITVCIG